MLTEMLPSLAVVLLIFYTVFARYTQGKYAMSGWESFKWFGLAVLVFFVVLGIAGEIRSRIDATKMKRERKAYLARQAMMESRHPGTRATLLSSGLWLLTDIATGKTVGEVADNV
ncbi:hypothetical protein [Ralstonia sp. ASV6]|uniref:hypothetical protein n=1 Tax=Ralstonia sp. ASV6 TaxID=2795124 RepID=UPI0018EB21C0|nr:hypothetical protein [Ralstonia sp. ASV6]